MINLRFYPNLRNTTKEVIVLSEPRYITPMLEGFTLGQAISDHNGVECYPAMRTDSDKRYIVKKISLPASQIQVEALLGAGIYQDAQAVDTYYRELACAVREEVRILDQLAGQRGFVPYQGCQIEPLENGIGYEVHLLSRYRTSLERKLRHEPMTHLGAVNLGIDLCAALVLAREAGWMYVDLKPENIFLFGDQEYRIGDLGFVSMDSLAYASLPDRYRSLYTAPEVSDAYARLNATMDTYALGLILYQIYNEGWLPFLDDESRKSWFAKLAAGEPMAPPSGADPEMTEIIRKACAYDPAERWQTPVLMGQALISYMQRIGADDIPIEPIAPAEEAPQEPAPEPPEEETPHWIHLADQLLTEAADGEKDPDEPDIRQLLSGVEGTEAAQSADTETLTSEAADILAQAEELIRHEAPAPVVVMEPIDVPIPEPIPGEVEAEAPVAVAAPPIQLPPRVRKKSGFLGKFLRKLFSLAIAAGLVFGAWYFYQNFYLQPIESLKCDSTATAVTVQVQTPLEEDKLTVICMDTYGNAVKGALNDGTVTFSGLQPGSQYIISLKVEGFHQLTGNTSVTFSTPMETKVMHLTAVTAHESGSAIISFGVEGQEPEQWCMTYETEGEEPKSVTFTGHSVTVTDLTVGAAYRFTLSAQGELQLVGENSITHVASPLIQARNLSFSAYEEGALTVVWEVPEEAAVGLWFVRCSSVGFEQLLEVTEPTATFTGLTSGSRYTVEVTAENMTLGVRTDIVADANNISGFRAEHIGSTIELSWEYGGAIPEGGWSILWTADGGPEQLLTTTENAATVYPAAPGSEYVFTLQPPRGTSLQGASCSVKIPNTPTFQVNGLELVQVAVKMYAVPELEGWDHLAFAEAQEANRFAPGGALVLLYSTDAPIVQDAGEHETVFVIRNSQGKLVSATARSRIWDECWVDGFCIETVSNLPTTAGSYTLSVFVDGGILAKLPFSIR